LLRLDRVQRGQGCAQSIALEPRGQGFADQVLDTRVRAGRQRLHQRIRLPPQDLELAAYRQVVPSVALRGPAGQHHREESRSLDVPQLVRGVADPTGVAVGEVPAGEELRLAVE